MVLINGQMRDVESLSQEELKIYQRQQAIKRNSQFRMFMQCITDAIPTTIRGVIQPTNRYLDSFGDYLNMILSIVEDKEALKK
jgi:hypothetical protein